MDTGILYIIATPIGNLEDMTFRSIRILKEEIHIACCEDTRQTKKLFDNYGIKLQMRPLHSHSSESVINTVINELLAGKNVAYLSDSGTPSISDPGSRLINAARSNDIKVSPIPGASALTALASVAGFPEKQIVFSGFLSKKEGKRITELTNLKQSGGIIIIYESPYRIKKLLLAISKVFPGGKILIGREMTKFFEEFISGTIEEVIANIDNLKEKGEFAVAVYADEKKNKSSDDDEKNC